MEWSGVSYSSHGRTAADVKKFVIMKKMLITVRSYQKDK